MCSGATIVERYRSRSGSLRACVQGGLENAGCERRFGDRFEGGSVPRVFGGNPRHRGVTEACGFPALEDMETMTLSREDGQARYVREELVLRVARMADIPALTELIAASVRGLQKSDYSKAQIDGAIGTVYGTDRTMIGDGTFFVVEAGSAIAGCGGWSRRRTAFGSDDSPVKDDSPLDPQTDAAKIRGFFVHPDWARRGIATQILLACEEAAGRAGFTRFELVSTLTGVPLYRRHGYIEVERITIILGNNEPYEAVRMRKSDAR
jgi:GNAT superfamily N-acetyltransferase